MTASGKIILKVAVLVAPTVTLLFSLYGGSKGNSIGGGGYDLSELVYSGLFTLFIICWDIWIIASLLMAKTDFDKQANRILLAIGVITLIVAIVWFSKHLR